VGAPASIQRKQLQFVSRDLLFAGRHLAGLDPLMQQTGAVLAGHNSRTGFSAGKECRDEAGVEFSLQLGLFAMAVPAVSFEDWANVGFEMQRFVAERDRAHEERGDSDERLDGRESGRDNH
jgi:hypothetical protein